MWGLWVTVAIAVVFILLASKFFGWQFFNAMNLNYWNSVYGYSNVGPIPVWAYPPLLASFYFHSTLIQASWCSCSARGSSDGRARCSCRRRG